MSESIFIKMDDSFIFDLLIIMIVIGILYFILFPSSPVKNLAYRLKDDVVKALVNPNLITPNYEAIFSSYQTYHLREKTFAKYFLNSGFPDIQNIASFGIALLAKYADDDRQVDYLHITEDLIVRLEAVLQEIDSKDPNPSWKPHWHEFSFSLTRMLAMYLYLGQNTSIQDVCHRRITEITPKINTSMSRTLTGSDLARVAIPRLMANYLYDRKTFKKEINSDIFKTLASVFNVTHNFTEEVHDGIYLDGSVISRNVATFGDLVTLGDFYAKVYRAFGYKMTIENFIITLFNQILHPKLDIVPYGLFGRTPRVTCKDILAYWPDYKRMANEGVRIFPFIGLGVFKSPKFVFSLRVQRENIVAYQSDHTNFQYAQGWIQMRKMFLINQHYGDIIGGLELKTQPGVMHTFNTKDRLKNFKAGDDPANFYTEDGNGFIGHLNNGDDRLMFWMNKYQFKQLFGNSKIIEFGICTDNGLIMRYDIKMDMGGYDLRIQIEDPDLKNNTKITLKTEEHLVGKGCLIIRENKNFSWRQVFDENQEPKKIELSKDLRSMKFKFKGVSYEVEIINKCYYTVRIGKNIVCAGSCRGNKDDKFQFKGQNYKRDPVSLMYKPVKSLK